MNQHVAFLRGINVGGNTKVAMGELKQVFERLGFTNVKTLLNSGNVIFTSKESDVQILTREIEQALQKTFGFSIIVVIRSSDQIKELVKKDPFKNIKLKKDTRLYITFTYTEDLPSHIELSKNNGTTELMKQIEQKYGKRLTTRNWNTILKINSLLI